jgi:hypothetical protein
MTSRKAGKMSKQKKKSQPLIDSLETAPTQISHTPILNPVYSIGAKIRGIYVSLFLILLIQFVVFNDYIFLNKLYLFLDIGSDSYNLFYPAFVECARYFRTDGIPTWSFSNGMGGAIFPGGLSSPFLWPLYLAGPDNLAYGIIFVELSKMVITGIVVYLYLTLLNFTKYTSIFGSVLASFIGYMVLGSTGWYGHSTNVVYFFLLLYSFELFYKKNNPIVFPLVVFFVATDPFRLYLYSIFMLTYVLLRLYSDKNLSFKESIIFLLKLTGLGAIGAGMSAVFLLDGLLDKINSPRVTGVAKASGMFESVSVFGLPSRLEAATVLLRFFSNDILGAGSEYKGFLNYLEAPIFYSGLISLLLAPQAIFLSDKRRRKALGIFFIVWMLPLVFPYFRYALYAFMGNYYKHGLSIFIPAIMLLYGIYGLEKIHQKKRINYGLLFGTLALLLIILHWPYFEGARYADTHMIDENLRILISCFLIGYTGILYFMRVDSARMYARGLLILLLCVETGWFSWVTVNHRNALSYEQFKDRIGYNDYTVDAIDYLKSIDKEFFRVNKDYSSSLAETNSINDAKIQGYFGTPSYSSFNQNEYIDFLNTAEIIPKGRETKTRWAIGLLQRPFLQAVASVKYNLLKSEDYAKRDVYFKMIYENLAAFGDVTVLKNNFFLPLGFTYDQYMLRKDFESLSRTHKDMAMFCAAVMDTQIEPLKCIKASEMSESLKNYKLSDFFQMVGEKRTHAMKVKSFSQKYITGDISLDVPQMIFFSIPIDRGWQAYVNDKPMPLIKANIGFMGLFLNPGSYHVELQYKVNHLIATVPISLLFFIVYLVVVFRKKILNFPTFSHFINFHERNALIKD